MPPEGGELKLEVFDDDTAARDDFLGVVTHTLETAELEMTALALCNQAGEVEEKRGAVKVWIGDPGSEPEEEAAAEPLKRSLMIMRAAGLKGGDLLSGKSDPY
eukprot:COSAG02_NODE_21627_length_781_cov_0.662757_2_plen_103_part_00